MKTLMVGGGAGHIGTNCCIEAINRGYKVVIFDNLHRDAVVDNLHYLQKHYGDKVEFVWGDCRNRDDFDRLPTDIEGILWLCGQCGVPWSTMWPHYDFETNALGTLNALEYARKCGNVPFAYASTNKTFSDIINEIPTVEEEKRYRWSKLNLQEGDQKLNYNIFPGLDFDEHQSMVPVAINQDFPITGFGKYAHSLYGISKLTGDLYVQEYHCQYGLPTAINKMSCIYGLFQKGVVEQGWVSWFLHQLQHGNGEIEFYGTGKQVRDVLDARDVARLYLDEIEYIDKCNGEIFTVGGGPENTKSLIEAVKGIEQELHTFKSYQDVKAVISHKEKRPADQDIYISSLKRVTEVLGWKPVIPFERTVRDMIMENR